MDSIALKLCSSCNKSAKKICSRCKSAYYCSKRCQKSDWLTHKILCADFSAFNTSTRPSSEHFRAILFPVEREKPEIIWLHCPWQTSEEEKDNQYPEYTSILGPNVYLRDMPIKTNPVLQRELSDTICIGYREHFLGDGSKSNKSIQSILALNPGRYYPWRGAIIAYGKVDEGWDPSLCKDIDMNDFRHITDLFFTYLEPSFSYLLEDSETDIQ